MANFVRMLAFGITLICLASLTSSTTWIYTAPRAIFSLAGSASASASAPATPVSFIADLRNREAKSAQLQEDKDVDGVEPLPQAGDQDASSEGNNEASPSLLQKKIGKILTKLRLIAQIKNAYHYKPEIHDHDTNITFSISNKNETESSTEIEPKEETSNIEPRIDNTKGQSENIQQIPLTESHGVPKNPKEEVESEPVKIDLEVNRVNDKLQNFNGHKSEKLKENEPSRLGALGVFFAELVGSIVGLTYGAVAQIASAGQSPVTISTSEGL